MLIPFYDLSVYRQNVKSRQDIQYQITKVTFVLFAKETNRARHRKEPPKIKWFESLFSLGSDIRHSIQMEKFKFLSSQSDTNTSIFQYLQTISITIYALWMRVKGCFHIYI